MAATKSIIKEKISTNCDKNRLNFFLFISGSEYDRKTVLPLQYKGSIRACWA